MTRREKKLNSEIEFHIEQQIRDYVAQGMDPAEARRRVRIEFGGAAAIKEECRDGWTLQTLETAWKDVRYGLRVLRSSPLFTLTAILALALGVGANSAMFSVIYAVLLRPLPYPGPDRLVWLTRHSDFLKADLAVGGRYVQWKAQTQLFENVAAYMRADRDLVGADAPERLQAAVVSASFLPTLGVQPILGRGISEDEDRPSGPRTCVLSYALFQRRFNGEASTIGKTINLDDLTYTVVGVLPRDFRFPQDLDVDLMVPLALRPETPTGPMLLVSVIGRLNPGATAEQARVVLAALPDDRIRPPGFPADVMKVVPLHQKIVGDSRTALLVLLAAVGLVLLIACCNVANLLMGRAAARHREVAVRAALGAARSRLIRQFLTESLLLATCGAGLGLLLARFAIQGFVALGKSRLPLIDQTAISPMVTAFTAVVAILTGTLFGLAPALSATRTDVTGALKEGSASVTSNTRTQHFRSALVISEIALALVVLVCAGLLVKSLWIIETRDPGFQPEHVLTADVNPIPSRWGTDARRLAFYNQAVEKFSAIPGVQASAFYHSVFISANVGIAGRPLFPPGQPPLITVDAVTPQFFQALGVRLKRGRFVGEQDGATAPWSVVLNETAALRLFPAEDPMGHQISMTSDRRPYTIVGIVADSSDEGVATEVPAIAYESMAQVQRFAAMHLVVRAMGDPMALAAVIRDQIRAVDRDQPVYNIQTMEHKLAASVAPRRFSVILLSAFAGLALTLALVGIYAVMYSSVAERTCEFGVRMALGAEPSDVTKLVISHGGRLVAAGLILGLAGAWAATRLLKTLLYGVTATDPLTFAAVALLLLAVAMLASYIPARRASRIDPMVALRHL